MLVALIIILVLIGGAVVGSIYSTFLVFYSNFSESENYHKAYYAAISALERGELVTKQRQPGYVGSGGFILGTGQGSSSNGGSDGNLSGFSYLGNNSSETSVFWTVNSRTTKIPSEGNGDVERLLSADDSSNYNMMGYENSEVFLLYYDNSNGNPYNKNNSSLVKSMPQSITGEIRLPKLLHLSGGYGNLNTGQATVGISNALPKDDAIVDWQIRGFSSDDKPFTVYSTQSTNGSSRVNYTHDSIFRESDINSPLRFKFSNVKMIIDFPSTSPDGQTHGQKADITVISEEEGNIKADFASYGFKNILAQNLVSLRFSLLNLLRSVNSGQYYPFLEYYTDFGTDVSDKYYTINGEGNFKDYKVNIIVQKPTVKESVLSNFTWIF